MEVRPDLYHRLPPDLMDTLWAKRTIPTPLQIIPAHMKNRMARVSALEEEPIDVETYEHESADVQQSIWTALLNTNIRRLALRQIQYNPQLEKFDVQHSAPVVAANFRIFDLAGFALSRELMETMIVLGCNPRNSVIQSKQTGMTCGYIAVWIVVSLAKHWISSTPEQVWTSDDIHQSALLEENLELVKGVLHQSLNTDIPVTTGFAQLQGPTIRSLIDYFYTDLQNANTGANPPRYKIMPLDEFMVEVFYASRMLHSESPGVYVVNLAPINQPGYHWIVIVYQSDVTA